MMVDSVGVVLKNTVGVVLKNTGVWVRARRSSGRMNHIEWELVMRGQWVVGCPRR